MVEYVYPTKTRLDGFAYKMPPYLKKSFVKYSEQITLNPPSQRFLANWNKMGKKRAQNSGINTVRAWAKLAATMLKKPADGYTTHSFRRSAATALADSGVSITNLKRHGRWKSDAVAEGYIDNSAPLLEEKMNLLNGSPAKPPSTVKPEPNPQCAEEQLPNASATSAASPTTNNFTYSNCNVTIVNGNVEKYEK